MAPLRSSNDCRFSEINSALSCVWIAFVAGARRCQSQLLVPEYCTARSRSLDQTLTLSFYSVPPSWPCCRRSPVILVDRCASLPPVKTKSACRTKRNIGDSNTDNSDIGQLDVQHPSVLLGTAATQQECDRPCFLFFLFADTSAFPISRSLYTG